MVLAVIVVRVLVTVLVLLLVDGLLVKGTAQALAQEDVLLQLLNLVLALENALEIVMVIAMEVVVKNVLDVPPIVKVLAAKDVEVTVLTVAVLLVQINLINKKKELTIK